MLRVSRDLVPETDASDGFDARPSARVGELLAQAANTGVDGLLPDSLVWAPGLGNKRVTVDDAPGVSDERFQEAVLVRGESQLASADPGPPRAGVEREVAGFHHLRRTADLAHGSAA